MNVLHMRGLGLVILICGLLYYVRYAYIRYEEYSLLCTIVGIHVQSPVKNEVKGKEKALLYPWISLAPD